MKKGALWLKSLVIAPVLGIALAGCAGNQNSKAFEVERLLSAAGFQIKLADTPEKLAHLRTLTQRRLVPHDRDGKVHYVYADAKTCKCLYAGSEKAYQRYEDLAVKRKIAEEYREAAEMNEASMMNWGMWGPWRPFW